jgi:hypothetical protein
MVWLLRTNERACGVIGTNKRTLPHGIVDPNLSRSDQLTYKGCIYWSAFPVFFQSCTVQPRRIGFYLSSGHTFEDGEISTS